MAKTYYTRVINLSTSDVAEYSLRPDHAVIAAYAQAHGDWNTWDYEYKYGHMLRIGKWTAACGDFCARLIA